MGLAWIYLLGGEMAGATGLLPYVVIVVPPMMLCSGMFIIIRSHGASSKAHFIVLLVALALATPLALQPWTPRSVFISKLDSIRPGMSEAEARQIMAGYLGGEKGESSGLYIPEALEGKGISHAIYYRWNETDGRYNADVGHVYLRDDRVVGTDFSPD